MGRYLRKLAKRSWRDSMFATLSKKIKSYFMWYAAAYYYTFSRIKFSIAKDQRTKEKIYKFRYKIYCEELSRKVKGVNNKKKIIKDEIDLDPNTLLFYVAENNEIVATLRIAIWPKGTLSSQIIKDYHLSKYLWLKQYTVCEFGRLMIKKNRRNRSIGPRLAAAITREMVFKYDMQFILLSCKPHLVTNYLITGICPYVNKYITYPDGLEIPMIGLIDKVYLNKINSPTKYIFSKIKSIDNKHINQFLKTLESPIMINDNALTYIEKFLSKRINPIAPFPSKATFAALIAQGCFIMKIYQPEELIHEGMVDRTIYFILKGKTDVIFKTSEKVTLSSGDIVGEFSYFLPTGKRTAKVICHHGVILVLKHSVMSYLAKNDPATYTDLLQFIIRSIIHKCYLENIHLDIT